MVMDVFQMRSREIGMSHCHFMVVKCEGDGEALYERNSVLHLLHSEFKLCRIVTQESQIVGLPGISDEEVNKCITPIFRCWIDGQ